MKAIRENLRAAADLLHDARQDVASGAGRLDEAEQKVEETMALLDARKKNIELDLQQPKGRPVRSKE
jgi:hypothetical protein